MVDPGLIMLGRFETFLQKYDSQNLFFFIIYLKPNVYSCLLLNFEMTDSFRFFLSPYSSLVKGWLLDQK